MRKLLVLFLLLAATASAETPPLLAVLEFDSAEQVLSDSELGALTDALRSAVKKEVGDRYKVLTRETMLELIPPEQLTCFVGKCVAEIGRMLQAPFIIAGSVKTLGSKKLLTIEAYESVGGQFLGSEQLRGASAEELYELLTGQARGLVRTWLNLAPVTRTAPSPALVEATAAVTAPAASPALEAEFWTTIKLSRDPGDFRAYLEQFPQGTFRPLAEKRMKDLTAEDASRPSSGAVRATAAATVPTTATPAAPASSSYGTDTRPRAESARPSFDCAKAANDDERTICAEPSLAALDRELSELYRRVLRVDPDARKSGRAWQARRRRCGVDVRCINDAYRELLGTYRSLLGEQAP